MVLKAQRYVLIYPGSPKTRRPGVNAPLLGTYGPSIKCTDVPAVYLSVCCGENPTVGRAQNVCPPMRGTAPPLRATWAHPMPMHGCLHSTLSLLSARNRTSGTSRTIQGGRGDPVSGENTQSHYKPSTRRLKRRPVEYAPHPP
jgi:hypothetical protein